MINFRRSGVNCCVTNYPPQFNGLKCHPVCCYLLISWDRNSGIAWAFSSILLPAEVTGWDSAGGQTSIEGARWLLLHVWGLGWEIWLSWVCWVGHLHIRAFQNDGIRVLGLLPRWLGFTSVSAPKIWVDTARLLMTWPLKTQDFSSATLYWLHKSWSPAQTEKEMELNSPF